MVCAVYTKRILLAVLLLQLSPLTLAHADRHNRFLDLDLPTLNKLLVNIDQNPTATARRTLAYLSSDTILRSGATSLAQLLEIYIPEELRHDHKHYIVKVDGKRLDQADQQLPTIDMIEKVVFICGDQNAHPGTNVVAITTFK